VPVQAWRHRQQQAPCRRPDGRAPANADVPATARPGCGIFRPRRAHAWRTRGGGRCFRTQDRPGASRFL